jgi:hypothetical protein
LQVSVLASGTLNALPEANMQTLTFENLYFSFLIDPATQTAYLQEWNDGEWSEADQFALPVPLATLDKKSRLARALRSFGDEGLRPRTPAGAKVDPGGATGVLARRGHPACRSNLRILKELAIAFEGKPMYNASVCSGYSSFLPD